MSTEGEHNWQDLAQKLQVSHNELLDFHQSHFSPDALASFGSDFMNLTESEKGMEHYAAEGWDDEEDDGLGYYEDGVKRTLTDEQIEIFRHSELRELQRKQERAKGSKRTGDDETATEENHAPSTGRNSTTSPVTRNGQKKKKKGRNPRPEPKPDLRKRTWDVVDAGLDSLDYD